MRFRVGALNGALVVQGFDGGIVVTEPDQNFVAVLANFRCGPAHRKWLVAILQRLTEDLSVANRGIMDRLRKAQVIDLRVVKYSIDTVDWPAGHAGSVQRLDPLGRRFERSLFADKGVELNPVFGP